MRTWTRGSSSCTIYLTSEVWRPTRFTRLCISSSIKSMTSVMPSCSVTWRTATSWSCGRAPFKWGSSDETQSTERSKAIGLTHLRKVPASRCSAALTTRDPSWTTMLPRRRLLWISSMHRTSRRWPSQRSHSMTGWVWSSWGFKTRWWTTLIILPSPNASWNRISRIGRSSPAIQWEPITTRRRRNSSKRCWALQPSSRLATAASQRRLSYSTPSEMTSRSRRKIWINSTRTCSNKRVRHSKYGKSFESTRIREITSTTKTSIVRLLKLILAISSKVWSQSSPTCQVMILWSVKASTQIRRGQTTSCYSWTRQMLSWNHHHVQAATKKRRKRRTRIHSLLKSRMSPLSLQKVLKQVPLATRSTTLSIWDKTLNFSERDWYRESTLSISWETRSWTAST